MVPIAKRARTGGGGSGGDRLSTLPDGLLHAVMSFLPARQMVQTCVLSKRWVDLWRSVPCLNLECQEFLKWYDLSDEKWEKMEDFTTNLLMLHNAPTVDTFRIVTGRLVDIISGHRLRDVDRWIRRGIKYCPRVLDITVSPGGGSRYKLPHMGSSSYRLEGLHLSRVVLDIGFTEQLRISCPVLQYLRLHRCLNDFSQIESSTLNNLVIKDCQSDFNYMDIRAPSLAFLRLCVPFRTYKKGVSLNGVKSLAKASIDVTACQMSAKGQAALLCGLFSVTNLELTGIKAMAILREEFDKSPLFNNLRTLSLGSCFADKNELNEIFRALARLLEMCPNLEKLTLQSCWFLEGSVTEGKAEDQNKWGLLQDQNEVSFHCKKLKLIEIKYDGDLDCDHQLFELMWGLWRNLKKATVTLTKNS